MIGVWSDGVTELVIFNSSAQLCYHQFTDLAPRNASNAYTLQIYTYVARLVCPLCCVVCVLRCVYTVLCVLRCVHCVCCCIYVLRCVCCVVSTALCLL